MHSSVSRGDQANRSRKSLSQFEDQWPGGSFVAALSLAIDSRKLTHKSIANAALTDHK